MCRTIHKIKIPMKYLFILVIFFKSFVNHKFKFPRTCLLSSNHEIKCPRNEIVSQYFADVECIPHIFSPHIKTNLTYHLRPVTLLFILFFIISTPCVLHGTVGPDAPALLPSVCGEPGREQPPHAAGSTARPLWCCQYSTHTLHYTYTFIKLNISSQI